MQKDLSTILWSILILVSLSSLAWAGQRDLLPPNVGQVDLVEDWRCPVTYPYNPNDGDQLIFTPFPLSVSLTTTGGPVLLSLVLSVTGTYTTTLILTADQSASGTGLVWGYYQPQATVTRIMAVPAGTHTFGAMIACANGGDPAWVTQAWLSVYELPSVAR